MSVWLTHLRFQGASSAVMKRPLGQGQRWGLHHQKRSKRRKMTHDADDSKEGEGAGVADRPMDPPPSATTAAQPSLLPIHLPLAAALGTACGGVLLFLLWQRRGQGGRAGSL